MQYMARLLLVMGICWVWLLAGCTDSPRYLMDQAERAFIASFDSVDFYLSQIEHPEKLAPKEQLRYAYLKGKIEFYTLGSQSDSLLREANRLAIQEKDSFYISQLLWLDIQRKSYYEKPDSVLLLSQSLQENFPQVADSLAFYMHYYRQQAYMQKGELELALQEAEKTCALTSDSIRYIQATVFRIRTLQALNEDGKVDSLYAMLADYMPDTERFDAISNFVYTHQMSWLEQKERWGDALQLNTRLKESPKLRASRNFYLKAQAFEDLRQVDSALYYYRKAEQGYSPAIASLASSRLMHYYLSLHDVRKAFDSMKKSQLLDESLLSHIESEVDIAQFKRTQLENELYQIKLKRQQQQLWLLASLLGLVLLLAWIIFFYLRIKRERALADVRMQNKKVEEEARILRYQNELLKKETEISLLREKEAWQMSKVADLREALFRRLSFYSKLPSLQGDRAAGTHEKIRLTDEEWKEITESVDAVFDDFTRRLYESFPALTPKDVIFCCLVKLNVNMQDLSDIYCVSKAAISKRKFRLKTEKLGITDEHLSLDDFLKDF